VYESVRPSSGNGILLWQQPVFILKVEVRSMLYQCESRICISTRIRLYRVAPLILNVGVGSRSNNPRKPYTRFTSTRSAPARFDPEPSTITSG
jgi:hypothetical protein